MGIGSPDWLSEPLYPPRDCRHRCGPGGSAAYALTSRLVVGGRTVDFVRLTTGG